jgi:hypothetical protein
MLELACPDEAMKMLAGNEAAVTQCQSAMAVRIALEMAGDEAGRS